MALFSILKTLHILFAIAAVGANFTYRAMLARAARQPDTLVFTLQTIRFLDRRLANPAYSLLLLTGLAMAFTIPVPLTTPWVLSALILYALVALLGSIVFAPVFRRQIELAGREGPQGQAYQAASRQGQVLGIAVTLIVVVIVILMVTKPALWGA